MKDVLKIVGTIDPIPLPLSAFGTDHVASHIMFAFDPFPCSFPLWMAPQPFAMQGK